MKRRRSKATQLSCIFGLCGQPPIFRMKMLLLCLFVLLGVTLSLGLMLSESDARRPEDLLIRVPDLKNDKLKHRPSKPTIAQVKRLVSEVNWSRLWYAYLKPILIERHPGSRGSQKVRRHVSSVLDSLSAGWSVQIDSFNSETPRGPINFSNILAVLDPLAPRRLLLACHYDTKNISLRSHKPKQMFVGASDSAVPCAMMLELVTALDSDLKMLKLLGHGEASTHLSQFWVKEDYILDSCQAIAGQKHADGYEATLDMSQVTLQLVFFDGAEAFEGWTTSNSLYGSRHLAEHMSHVSHPPGSEHTTLLHAVDLFILLALIGAPNPTFVNHFEDSARWFEQLALAEKRLHNLGLLSSHSIEQAYFRKNITVEPINDDHVPFLQQGVPVLHVIATPFPSYRHTTEDGADKVHSDTVENLTKVLVVFLAEYLGL